MSYEQHILLAEFDSPCGPTSPSEPRCSRCKRCCCSFWCPCCLTSRNLYLLGFRHWFLALFCSIFPCFGGYFRNWIFSELNVPQQSCLLGTVAHCFCRTCAVAQESRAVVLYTSRGRPHLRRCESVMMDPGHIWDKHGVRVNPATNTDQLFSESQQHAQDQPLSTRKMQNTDHDALIVDHQSLYGATHHSTPHQKQINSGKGLVAAPDLDMYAQPMDDHFFVDELKPPSPLPTHLFYGNNNMWTPQQRQSQHCFQFSPRDGRFYQSSSRNATPLSSHDQNEASPHHSIGSTPRFETEPTVTTGPMVFEYQIPQYWNKNNWNGPKPAAMCWAEPLVVSPVAMHANLSTPPLQNQKSLSIPQTNMSADTNGSGLAPIDENVISPIQKFTYLGHDADEIRPFLSPPQKIYHHVANSSQLMVDEHGRLVSMQSTGLPMMSSASVEQKRTDTDMGPTYLGLPSPYQMAQPHRSASGLIPAQPASWLSTSSTPNKSTAGMHPILNATPLADAPALQNADNYQNTGEMHTPPVRRKELSASFTLANQSPPLAAQLVSIPPNLAHYKKMLLPAAQKMTEPSYTPIHGRGWTDGGLRHDVESIPPPVANANACPGCEPPEEDFNLCEDPRSNGQFSKHHRTLSVMSNTSSTYLGQNVQKYDEESKTNEQVCAVALSLERTDSRFGGNHMINQGHFEENSPQSAYGGPMNVVSPPISRHMLVRTPPGSTISRHSAQPPDIKKRYKEHHEVDYTTEEVNNNLVDIHGDDSCSVASLVITTSTPRCTKSSYSSPREALSTMAEVTKKKEVDMQGLAISPQDHRAATLLSPVQSFESPTPSEIVQYVGQTRNAEAAMIAITGLPHLSVARSCYNALPPHSSSQHSMNTRSSFLTDRDQGTCQIDEKEANDVVSSSDPLYRQLSSPHTFEWVMMHNNNTATMEAATQVDEMGKIGDKQLNNE